MEIKEDGYYILTEEEKEKLREKAKGRSLAERRPELAKEWSERNGDLSPDMVRFNDFTKVWWVIEGKHPKTNETVTLPWFASPYSRIKGNGCPYLSGRAVLAGFNDLKTINEKLAEEWDYQKNFPLTPQDVTANSHKKVWWRIVAKHPVTEELVELSWLAPISDRNFGQKCPYLSGRGLLQGFNDFQTTHAELAEEFHPTKNGNLKPTDFTHGCDKKVWWIKDVYNPELDIVETFEWKASVKSRVIGNDCPYTKYSKLSNFVFLLLKKKGIKFIPEVSFEKCRHHKKLPFDIFINDNMLIEIDGKQHFIVNCFFGGDAEYKNLCIRDSIKNQYCKDNNIRLLRIPYVFKPVECSSKIEQFVMSFIQTGEIPDEILEFYKKYPENNYYSLFQK